jgi:hypothetical protein
LSVANRDRRRQQQNDQRPDFLVHRPSLHSAAGVVRSGE